MIVDIQWSPEAESQLKALQAAAENSLRLGRKTRQFSLFKQVEGCILSNPLRPDEKVFEAYAQNNTPGACLGHVFPNTHPINDS
jgi:hypothetical protein